MNNQSVIYGVTDKDNQMSLVGVNVTTSWDGMLSLLGEGFTPGCIGPEESEGIYGTIGSNKVNEKIPDFYLSSSGSLYEKPNFTQAIDRVSDVG